MLRTCIAKRPVFISLPTDVVHLQCAAPSVSLDLQPFTSDQAALKECIGTLTQLEYMPCAYVVLLLQTKR